jgi:N-acyl-D-amino-acid deacylase
LIEEGIQSGLDLMFDTYSYHCGFSVINVLYPEWFLARVPEVYRDSWALLRLRAELELIVALLGFGYENVQVLNTKHPSLKKYNGMFLKDIAEDRGMSQFDNFLDVTEKSEGRAVVLNHRYSSQENIKKLMMHPASLFMTDALVYDEGAQNPASFGCYPRFLQFARDFQLISLEECVAKMTGAVARRFQLPQRGFLKEGHFADVTVFDWANVMDRNTREVTDNRPAGIEQVFINGQTVLKSGQAAPGLSAGQVIRAGA